MNKYQVEQEPSVIIENMAFFSVQVNFEALSSTCIFLYVFQMHKLAEYTVQNMYIYTLYVLKTFYMDNELF